MMRIWYSDHNLLISPKVLQDVFEMFYVVNFIIKFDESLYKAGIIESTICESIKSLDNEG